MKGLTAADRTIAALRVACRARVDWHAERHPYRVRQVRRYRRLAHAYAGCVGVYAPCFGPAAAHDAMAQALALAASRRALAYEAVSAFDAGEAWNHWKQMRGHLRSAGLTAAVWCPVQKR